MTPLRYLLVLVLALCLAGAAAKKDGAAKSPKGKKGAPLIGAILGVEGSTLKIAPKGSESTEALVATDANTVFELDGKPAKLADLAKGQRARIFPATGTAEKIVATSAKPKKAPATKPATRPTTAPKAPPKPEKA